MSRSSYLWKFLTFGVILAVLGLAAGAMAQTNWTGAVGANWSEPANWGSGVPDSATDAYIDHDITVINDPVLDADGSASNLYVGTGYDGLLTVSSNYTLAVANNIYLGGATGTTGAITQSDGAVSVVMLYGGSVIAGQSGAGNYTMTGGTLNIGYFSLGNHGTATFTQSGGVVNSAVALWLGDNVYPGAVPSTPGGPGSATYVLEGNAVFNGPTSTYIQHLGPWGGHGVLTVQGEAVFTNYAITVDLSQSTVAATGIINLHDQAQISLTGYLTLAASSVANGTLNQDGGTLTVPTINNGLGAGTYNFTGGTLNVSKVNGMDLVNGGGTVNVGGIGAVSNLAMGLSGPVSNNIALGKTATQSNTGWGMPAERAVDGTYATFSHTANEENSWWKVDLTGDDSNTSVHDILLTARPDGYTHGLSNFWVRVLDKDGATVVWQDTFVTDPSELLAAGESLAVSLPSAVDGRYVQVQLDGYNLGALVGYPGETGYLTIAEVEVGDVMRYGYSQSAGGTLGVELDPTNELSDKLVAGAVTLDGTLDVTSLGGTFAAGQVFDILDWETLVGTFDTVNLPTLSGSLGWDTSNLYVTGELAIASAGPQIPGDTDGDNIVDEDDAAVVAGNWGQSVGEGGFAAGDFNGDHVVNAADAAIQVANWGSHVGESTGVPEPGTFVLLLMGAAALLAPARRGRHAH